MKSTIDGAGRLVVPKALRVALGFHPGQELEVAIRDGRLEIEIAPTEMALQGTGDSIVAVPMRKLPPLTTELVRATLDHVRP